MPSSAAGARAVALRMMPADVTGLAHAPLSGQQRVPMTLEPLLRHAIAVLDMAAAAIFVATGERRAAVPARGRRSRCA